jgi:hypothetical protein
LAMGPPRSRTVCGRSAWSAACSPAGSRTRRDAAGGRRRPHGPERRAVRLAT